jgi:membrane associated rhomboid family serine protease
MFFFFPFGADVPLYYRPWATVGLIIVNVAVFVVAVMSGGFADALVLRFGDGVHPTEWLTAAFMHADIFHLVGNMLFLWPFGLVVEARLAGGDS